MRVICNTYLIMLTTMSKDVWANQFIGILSYHILKYLQLKAVSTVYTQVYGNRSFDGLDVRKLCVQRNNISPLLLFVNNSVNPPPFTANSSSINILLLLNAATEAAKHGYLRFLPCKVFFSSHPDRALYIYLFDLEVSVPDGTWR